MKEQELRKYAARAGINFTDPTVSATGWLQAHCPLAPWRHGSGRDRRPSFGLRVNDTGYSAYKCFTCGSHGSIPGLVRLLANYTNSDSLRNIARDAENAEIAGEPEHLPEWDDYYQEEEKRAFEWPNPASSFQRYPFAYGEAKATEYLRERGISLITAFVCGLRYDPEESRILFPVRTIFGRLCGFTGRACDKRTIPKVRDYSGLEKRKYLLGGQQCYTRRRTRRKRAVAGRGQGSDARDLLAVVEGGFDYARLKQYGFPYVVALLGSECTTGKIRGFEQLDMPVVWFVDNDAAGEKCLYGNEDAPLSGALHKMYNIVSQFTVTWPTTKRKFGKKWRVPNDPDELTYEEAWSMYENAELFMR